MNPTTRLAFALLLLLAGSTRAADKQPAPAKPSRGRLLLAPKLGVFKSAPSRLPAALFVGAEVGYLTPFLGDALALTLELDWRRSQASGAASDPRLTVNGPPADGSYRLGEAEIGLLLSALYRAEDTLLAGLTPYGGGGPGFFWHRTATTAFGSTTLETQSTVGLQLLAGADYRLGPGAVFGEAHYHFSRVRFRSTGNANVGGLALAVGYRFRF